MRLIPLGELIGIDKGKKPARLFAQPAPGRHRFLQIDDLRPNAIPKFVESFACPKASRTDVIIAWDGANAGTVACNLEGYVGSTLAVLRLDDSKVDAAYVSRFLEGQFHRLQATAKGATVPHLSRDFVEELRIPLPEFSEQKRVAAILERADRLWRLRRYSLQMSENFLSVAYLRLFGDPRTNPKKIPIAELGKYIAFLTSGSRGWAEHYAKSGARFIRSLDVQMNRIPTDNAVFVDAPPGAEAERTRVKAGDVLLTVTGSRIGRVAPVPTNLEGAYVSHHVAIIRLQPGLLPRFVSMFLSLEMGGQLEIRRFQYGQTKPGLGLNQIGHFRVQVPALDRQREFTQLADRYETLRSRQMESLRQAEHLFQTLLHRAFTSGL